jgi:hypothetical protein
MGWQSEVFTFVATSTSTAVKLESLTTGTFGPAIDDVRITAEATDACVHTPIPGQACADLVETAVSGPPSALVGNAIGISDTVSDPGSEGTGSFSVGLYLSTDAAITSSDTLLGTRSVAGLASGGSSSGTTTVTIPLGLAAGTYYLGAIADSAGTVPESNEGNNALTGGTIVITAGGTDLLQTAVSGPAIALTGASIAISDTTWNQGTVNTSTSFYVGLYLSTDATITTSDTRLGTRSIASLAAGATSSGSKSVTIPLTTVPGTYYLGAIADYSGRISESNEANNARTGNPIQINFVDLVETAVSGPTTAAAGTYITTSDTVVNVGNGDAAGAFTMAIYLSTDATITTSDLKLGTRSLTGLAAGATSTLLKSVKIPPSTTAGTYYLGAIADYTAKIKETNEANNAVAGNVIQIN